MWKAKRVFFNEIKNSHVSVTSEMGLTRGVSQRITFSSSHDCTSVFAKVPEKFPKLISVRYSLI